MIADLVSFQINATLDTGDLAIDSENIFFSMSILRAMRIKPVVLSPDINPDCEIVSIYALGFLLTGFAHVLYQKLILNIVLQLYCELRLIPPMYSGGWLLLNNNLLFLK